LEGSFEPLYYPVRGQADAPLNHNLFTQNSGHPRRVLDIMSYLPREGVATRPVFVDFI
jgi:hypothetical protein